MGLSQFGNSLRRIARNPHIHRPTGIARHLLWQARKVMGGFPFEQVLSHSRIIAADRRCGVSALIYSQGLYDYNNMSLLRALLRNGGVFADVGANIGPYTLIASENPDARVFAFEPHPDTFKHLAGNCELNSRRNVTLFQVALSDRSGKAFLTNGSGSSTNHLTTDSQSGTVSVPCARADAVFGEASVAPDYVKIDVEGFEYQVLAGFGDLLAEVAVVFVEVNGLSESRSGHSGSVDVLLRDQGFIGPLRCDFDRRVFRRIPGPSTEDAIYLARAFEQDLITRGFHIVT